MKIFQISNDWTDMGYITGMALAGMFLWSWTYIFIFILSIILTLLMKRKAKTQSKPNRKGCGIRIFEGGDGETIGVCGEEGMYCFGCRKLKEKKQ